MNILKTYKPITPSFRYRKILSKKNFNKKQKVKQLLFGFNKLGGRNNQGKLCVTKRGGGSSKLYRIIDFKKKFTVPAIVLRIEFDPNRTSLIALILYKNYYLSYIIANENLKEGDIIEFGPHASHALNNNLPLKYINPGTIVNNIELKPNKGSKIARSAGTSAKLVNHLNNYYSLVFFNSNEYKKILSYCTASLGVVSNKQHKDCILGKAGASRWAGKKPHVRGVAKNPVDHPHGGGEGRTSGGRKTSVNFTGRVKKGSSTRLKSKPKLIKKIVS